ncbi:MAG: hypothetical protein ACE5IW_03070 [bacterium]
MCYKRDVGKDEIKGRAKAETGYQELQQAKRFIKIVKQYHKK